MSALLKLSLMIVFLGIPLDLMAQGRKALVQITVTSTEASFLEVLEGAKYQGSGVVVGKTNLPSPDANGYIGHIVTADHVLDKAKEIEVRFTNGALIKGAKIIKRNDKVDIAVLEVYVPNDIQPAALGAPVLQKNVTAVGYHKAVERIHTGEVRYIVDGRMFIDCEAMSGDSGGPIFDDTESVVGIVSGGWWWMAPGTTWPLRAGTSTEVLKLLGK